MKNMSLRNSIFVAFFIALFVVVFFVWVSFQNMKLVNTESEKINVCSQTQKVIDIMNHDLNEVEASGSNLILTPNSHYLKNYNLAVSRFHADTTSLSKINVYDTLLQNEIAVVKNLIEEKANLLKDFGGQNNTNGVLLAGKIDNYNAFKNYVENIRSKILIVENKKRSLVLQSVELQQKIAKKTSIQFLTLACVFILFLLIFLFTINNVFKKRKRVNDQLKLQASLIESVSDGIIRTNDKHIITGWNKYAEKIYGYHPEEAIGKNIWQLIKFNPSNNTDKTQLQEAIVKDNYLEEYVAVKKNGIPISILSSVTILKNNDGDVSGYLTVHRDISDRKKNEKELKNFNALLEQQVAQKTEEITNILDRITDGFIAINSNYEFTFVNNKANEMIGFDKVSIVGDSIWAGLPDKISTQFNEACKKCFETQQYLYFENYYQPMDIWVENFIYPSKDGLSVFFKDITYKKKADLAVKQSQQDYKNLIDHLHAAVVVHNPDTSISLCNKEAAELLGLTIEELEGKFANDTSWNFVTTEGKKLSKDEYPVMQVIATGKPIRNLVYGIKNPHKAIITWVQINAFPAFDDSNKLKQVVISFVDVTDSKKNEVELLKREEILNRAQQIAQIGNWELDLLTKELKWSKEMYRIFELEGYSADELYPAYRNKFTPEELGKLDKVIRHSIETGEGYGIDHPIICNDGSIKHIQGIGETIKDTNGIVIGLKGTGQDITKIKKTEERLKKSYDDIRELAVHLQHIREEERTSMAREIHDELGQQLTGLKMDISWLNKKIQPQETDIKNKFTSALELIEETVKSVREISSKLRPSMLDDLGLIAALEWQSNEFEKRSGIKTSFINLTENSIIPQHYSTGLFRIFQESLTNVARHSDAKNVVTTLEVNDNMLLLTIADNGKGFVLHKIRTHKTLGLFGMKERTIIMGGKYKINTSPGNGTIVSIAVPLV